VRQTCKRSPVNRFVSDMLMPFVLFVYRRVNAYYIFIHPYLPLLPPPAVPRYADRPFRMTLTNAQPDNSSLPLCPRSPFLWALMAILVLVPLPDDPDPMCEAAVILRRSLRKYVCADGSRER
jgi:hypothetical protein